MDPDELDLALIEPRQSIKKKVIAQLANSLIRAVSELPRGAARLMRGGLTVLLTFSLLTVGWLAVYPVATADAAPVVARVANSLSSPKYLVKETLRVRIGPSTSASQMGTVFAGEKVEVLCQDSGTNVRGSKLWDFIQYDVTGTKGLKKRGWVSDYFVSTHTTGRLPGVKFGGCPPPQKTPGPGIPRPGIPKPNPKPRPDRTCQGGGTWINGDIRLHYSTQIPGGFRISFQPTKKARAAGASDFFSGKVRDSMWEKVTACVELTGTVRNSIWQQLDCHVIFGLVPKTGPTYDLESWHKPLDRPNRANYILSECLNNR